MSRGAKRTDAEKREELVARIARSEANLSNAQAALAEFDKSIRDRAAALLAVVPEVK